MQIKHSFNDSVMLLLRLSIELHWETFIYLRYEDIFFMKYKSDFHASKLACGTWCAPPPPPPPPPLPPLSPL